MEKEKRKEKKKKKKKKKKRKEKEEEEEKEKEKKRKGTGFVDHIKKKAKGPAISGGKGGRKRRVRKRGDKKGRGGVKIIFY